MTEDRKMAAEIQHFGKDCPKGMVQIEFVGADKNARINAYRWKPTKTAFLEVYVDGQRFCIDVGDITRFDGTTRRGIHVCGPMNMEVDKHSLNAADLMIQETK